MRKKRLRIVIFAGILLFVITFGLIFSGIRFLFQMLDRPVPEQSEPLETVQEPEEPLNTASANVLSSELYSTNAVLVSLSDDRVLYEKGGKGRTYPASLTKMMTVILAIEAIPDLETQITLPEELFQKLYDENASMAGFLPNENVKAVDLLYAAMLPSGAEAAEGLALYASGSIERFVERMNQKAEELGMEDTHFLNTTGLHDPNHYTTAYDMALLLRYALKNDTFRKVFTTDRYSTSPTSLHKEGITFVSTLSQALKSPEFEGGEILGGKTGYTDAAGLCLATLARKNGREYLFITTGAPGNHDTEQYNIDDAVFTYAHISDK